jgi:hypothetical protein
VGPARHADTPALLSPASDRTTGVHVFVRRELHWHFGSARGKCEEFRSHLPRGIRSVGGAGLLQTTVKRP